MTLNISNEHLVFSDPCYYGDSICFVREFGIGVHIRNVGFAMWDIIICYSKDDTIYWDTATSYPKAKEVVREWRRMHQNQERVE